MPHPVLFRFSTRIYYPTPPSNGPIPYANAQVHFYYQGATLASTVRPIDPNAFATLDVYDPGDLQLNDVVQAGVGGPTLLITTAPPLPPGTPASITIQNISGTTATLSTGTRLIIISRRPRVYLDPIATTSLGSQALTDANGDVAAYIAQPRFDYSLHSISTLASSSGSTTNSPALSWLHQGHTAQNCILVSLSWGPGSELSESPTVANVTVGGLSMTLVAQTASTGVYKRVSPDSLPPPGSLVQVTFTSPANAVGGALSLSNVDNILTQVSTGTSATPSIDLPSTSPGSQAFDVIAVNTPRSDLLATPNGRPTLWNSYPGSGLFNLLGALSSNDPLGGTLTLRWKLTNPTGAAWSLIGLEVRPQHIMPTAYLPDAEGGVIPTPAWINARAFPSLGAALAAVPPTGGVLYLPSGVYSTGHSGLTLNTPNVTLLGDGTASTIITGTLPFTGDILRITAARCALKNLRLEAFATGASSCLTIEGATAGNCVLENVLLLNAAGSGLVIRDAIDVTAINVESVFHSLDGCRVERTIPSSPTAHHRFIGGAFSSNGRQGMVIVSSVTGTGVGDNVSLMAPLRFP